MAVAHSDNGRPVDIRAGDLELRLADSEAEIEAAQALRYRIFYETMGARASRVMARSRRDSDPFDEICDHLMVLDHSRGVGADAVVGTYRLIRREAARRGGQFYSAAEYDISRLVTNPGPVLELGRSCVDPAYRARATGLSRKTSRNCSSVNAARPSSGGANQRG